ncbi:hypothetical protein ILUMI_00850 [Ignelater luminosus]|uniref:DnaJ homolog subfamily C member 1 n=1 Tax=Ignelater luminosus TaxID=2038154 RepID=A0A8K0GPT5_IGNLU|nr:hypothetical protein ILUMI_00850 [Ignelater luminosus]
MRFTCIIIFILCINRAVSWDSEQLEVFDVVEEIKVNFYEFLKVPQDANIQTIKASFRRLSLELHPDKNPAENADEQFRNLVAIYEVLKDSKKRKYYDEVLINGLPNWRSAVYYYRHVRRIGLLELCLFLFILVSIGQYLVGWASYLERKYTLEQVRGRKQKKIVATIEIPKPSLYNTLPVQIPCLLWTIVTSLPWVISLLKQKAMEKLEEEPIESSDEEPVREVRGVRKRKPGFVVPDGPTFEVSPSSEETKESGNQVPIKSQVAPVVGGLWTDDNLTELIQLINRYPGGTPGRWELIAETIGRSVAEVTYMANKVKSNGYRIGVQETEPEEPVRVKVKTKGVKLETLTPQTESIWTQEQQKAMENALAKYPKGCIDRWDCIAEFVPGKTKEQCMMRYKHLVELVKKQKENRTQEQANTEA